MPIKYILQWNPSTVDSEQILLHQENKLVTKNTLYKVDIADIRYEKKIIPFNEIIPYNL